MGELASQSAGIELQISSLANEKRALDARAETLELQIESVRQARTATETTRAQVENGLKSANERLAAASGRRELLEDLQRRRDGISNAARAVLDMQLPGTRGLVAELLDVPRELTVPVEGLLGEDAGAVVVETTAAAVEAVRRLSEAEAGRAKIISLERAATHAAASRRAGLPALSPIEDKIAAAPGCQPLVHALFGAAFLAGGLDEVLSANGATAGLTLVTAAGETVGPDGGIAGGRAGQAGGLIWRKAEIETLLAAENEIREEAAVLEARGIEIDDCLAALAVRLTGAEKALAETRGAMAQMDARADAARSRRAGLEREKSVIDNETATLDGEMAAAAEERLAVKARVEETRLLGAALDERIASLKAQRNNAVENRERANAHATRLKVKLASSLEKQASLERQYADARAALEEKARALETATAEIAAAREAAEAEGRALESATAGMAAAHGDASSARVVLAARSRRQRELRDETARLAPALKELRLAVDAARQALGDISIEEREVSVRFGDVINRAREEFDAGVDALSAQAEGIDDPSAADAEIEELSKKLVSMGGVNMEALAELEGLQSRHSFLAGQRDDLAQAKDSLEGIIARTRATSRKMFLESFESVREHFASMFRRLFGGGRAECILLDPEDVLESPIQITAKPPGKEPSNLNLLSGGEKAMTAVALLFAMFATRPSPFLILDEVDAPLDESNIGRFIDLMYDYLPGCQFVVITHNRKTMAAASAIYGITMEEQGVSKKVSVSFKSQAATPEPVTV
jgi:chromosome segregation protein